MRATNRKNIILLTVIVGAVVCLWGSDAPSQRSRRARLGGGVDLSVVSEYVWRGFVQNDDWALQPDIYLKYHNFIVSIWGSMDLTDRSEIGIDSQWGFSELDYVAQYTFPMRLVNLSAGYSFYDYPNTPAELRESTQEVYAKAEFNVFLEPAVEVFYDVDEVKGWYGRVSATYTQPQGGIDWKLRCSVGVASKEFSNYYFGSREPLFDSVSFCDLELRLFTTIDLGANFSLKPFIALSYLPDGKLRDVYDSDGEFFGGVNVSWTF